MEGDTQQSTDLGGLVIPPESKNESGAPDTVNGSASEKIVSGRRGRPKGSKNSSGANDKQSVPVLSKEQFAALYSPKLWGKIAKTPADCMALATGSKHFEVSEKEEETLGETCSIAAACFASADPRWLALAAALITVSNVYGTRMAMYLADKRRERVAREENEIKNRKS